MLGKILIINLKNEIECSSNSKQRKKREKYSSVPDQITIDLATDGSMMFKVTNKEESMLFCADVGVKMSDEIMSHYADELPSDYIQMGHHGNGGLSEEFYRKVHPKVAFFDAPE